eukprot:gnl/MRDRNA2_/MRDRNA2_79029_c0_seq1.p1 gnl/MRDRNA2_/MRDRNA2_79029_c0~~gnl/MRDRNA2_/MRDRNA2_79029_c0_seq1.p1  ORF type:complete len:1033 (-),score=100.90 gnl/MRDRNA2_/MRDRNA2_79029_c0_seq1:23-3100(-)
MADTHPLLDSSIGLLFWGTWISVNAQTCPYGQWSESLIGGTGACLPCDPGCPSGTYREACGGTNEGRCVPCTNQVPSFSEFSGGGGLTDACPFACNPGYFLEALPLPACKLCETDCPFGSYCEKVNAIGNPHERQCRPCHECEVGRFRAACQGLQEGLCQGCDNGPLHSHYTSSGGLSNNCTFACNTDFFRVKNDIIGDVSCQACVTNCSIGFYRGGCGGSDPGQCVPCSIKSASSHFVGDGGLRDACPWECDADFFLPRINASGNQSIAIINASGNSTVSIINAPGNSTIAIINASGNYTPAIVHMELCEACPADCPTGQYRNGCGLQDEGSCVACTNGPNNSHYTSAGGLTDTCNWECNETFHELGGYPGTPDKDGVTCIKCDDQCPVGQYRVGCKDSHAGNCTNCTSPNALAIFIGDGNLLDACPWMCKPDYYTVDGTCEPCPTDCPVGHYRKGCMDLPVMSKIGLTVDHVMGACVACENKPSDSHYTGSGGLQNSCSWECDNSYHEHGGHPEKPGKDGVSCIKCGARCPVGQFRSGCQESHEGICENCTLPNPMAIFVGDGDLRDACPWICKADYYTVDGECKPCPEDCAVGQYRKGCMDVAGAHPKPINNSTINIDGQSLAGSCVVCENAPPNSHYTGNGGLQNSCSWECDESYREHGGRPGSPDKDGVTCIRCSAGGEKCPVGQFRSGCHETSAGSCINCTLPDPMAIFTGDGDVLDACPWICEADHYQVNGRCEACPKNCSAGSYRKGCMDVTKGAGTANAFSQAQLGSCVPCKNAPSFATYTGSGGLLDSCSWECKEGFFQEGDACKSCKVETSCAIGQYLSCGLRDSGTCTPCTGAPMLTVYSTDGGLDDNCAWQCLVNWPVEGLPCVAGFMVNLVFFSVVLICVAFLLHCLCCFGQEEATSRQLVPREEVEPPAYKALNQVSTAEVQNLEVGLLTVESNGTVRRPAVGSAKESQVSSSKPNQNKPSSSSTRPAEEPLRSNDGAVLAEEVEEEPTTQSCLCSRKNKDKKKMVQASK